MVGGSSSYLPLVLSSNQTAPANADPHLFFLDSPRIQTNIVSMWSIIDEANCFDQLASWLNVLEFRNFTFVVVEGVINQYILENSNRLAILRRYGEIIPRLPLMQGYAPGNRILNANFTLNEFAAAFGYTPKGVMDFVPDTYTSQYLLNKGVSIIKATVSTNTA